MRMDIGRMSQIEPARARFLHQGSELAYRQSAQFRMKAVDGPDVSQCCLAWLLAPGVRQISSEASPCRINATFLSAVERRIYAAAKNFSCAPWLRLRQFQLDAGAKLR